MDVFKIAGHKHMVIHGDFVKPGSNNYQKWSSLLQQWSLSPQSTPHWFFLCPVKSVTEK